LINFNTGSKTNQMDTEKLEYDFMKSELQRLQLREFEIYKGRNTILQLMFISTSGILAAIGVLFKYKEGDDFTLLIVGILIILIPIVVLYNYLRLVTNTGELSIARIQKFLVQISLTHYSPEFYPKFDIYPSVSELYNPLSQLSGFTKKTMSFYRVLIISTCLLIGIGVVASELFIFQKIEIFNNTLLLKSIKPFLKKFDWIILVLSIILSSILSYKLLGSLKNHSIVIENTLKTLLSNFNKPNLFTNKTIDQYFDCWKNNGVTKTSQATIDHINATNIQSKTRQNKITMINKRFAQSLVGAGFILMILFLISFILGESFNFGQINSNKWGQFGDIVGGVIGALWALAGVILFFLALDDQKETLRLQREEYKLQLEELQETRKTFEQQNYDTFFFSLIKIYTEVVHNMDLDIKNTSGEIVKRINGRDAISTLYKSLKNEFFRMSNKNSIKAFETQYKNNISDLEPLLHNFSNIMAHIIRKKESITDQYYVKTFTNMLSQHELVFIFYYMKSKFVQNDFHYTIPPLHLLWNRLNGDLLLDDMDREELVKISKFS